MVDHSNEKKYHIKVTGVTYRCFLQYVSTATLDPLSAFLFGVVKKGQRNIDRLIRSFGLSSRLIENVIADLIRKNYVRLDLSKNELVPNEFEDTIRSQHYVRGYIDVWQDHTSGAVIPANMISFYSEKPKGSIIPLPPLPPDKFTGFCDAADSQLIGMLIRVRPSISFGDNTQERLNRIIRRQRIRNRDLFFPLSIVSVPDRKLHFIEAPELPFWITRSWNAMVSVVAKNMGLSVSIDHHIIWESRKKSAKVFQNANLSNVKGQWAQAFKDCLEQLPPPLTRSELAHLEDEHSRFQESLSSLAALELTFFSNGLQECLELAFQTAKHYVLIGIQAPSQDLAKEIRKIWRKLIDKDGPQLMFIVNGEENLVTLEKSLTGLRPLILLQPGVSDFILVDGFTLFIGDLIDLNASEAPFFRIDGKRTAEAMLGHVQNRASSFTEEGMMVRNLAAHDLAKELWRSTPPKIGTISVTELASELDDLHQQLAKAIQDYKIKPQNKQMEENDTVDDETVDPDAMVEPQEPNEDKSLQEIHPNIVEIFQNLERSFTMELVGPYSIFAFLDGYEQSAILVSAVYFDPVKTDTLTIFSELSKLALETGIIALLNKALTEKNRRIDVILGDIQSQDQNALVKKLYEQIPHHSFGIFQSERPLPFGGLVLEPYVAVGSFHPLRDELFPGKNDGFTYIIKNLEVAQSMLKFKQKAKKVPRI